jgi:hemerythrin-like domain-containing protein
MADAIALLKADHKQVKALFKQAEELGDRAFTARARLFDEIDAALTLHTKIEETILYPAVKQKTKPATDERDEVLEAYEEHAAAKALIARIRETDPKDETYRAKLQVLGELVDHHVTEEEASFFPEARKLLGTEMIDELGDEIAAAKEAEGVLTRR